MTWTFSCRPMKILKISAVEIWKKCLRWHTKLPDTISPRALPLLSSSVLQGGNLKIGCLFFAPKMETVRTSKVNTFLTLENTHTQTHWQRIELYNLLTNICFSHFCNGKILVGVNKRGSIGIQKPVGNFIYIRTPGTKLLTQALAARLYNGR